jgi:hypothetical protein
MRHAGRPRVSTSRPVAAAARVTDFVGSPSSDAIGARRLSTGPAAPANDFRRRAALSAAADDPGFAARLRIPPGLFARAKCEDRLCPGQVDRLLAGRPWPRPRRSIAVHLGRFLLPLEIPPLPRIIIDDDCGRIAQTPTPPWPGMASLGRLGGHIFTRSGRQRRPSDRRSPGRSLMIRGGRVHRRFFVRRQTTLSGTAAVCTAARPRSDIFDMACERAVTSASD